jgi:hypothetical protein
MLQNQPWLWDNNWSSRVNYQHHSFGGVNGDQLETIDPQLCDEPLASVVSKLTYSMYAQTTDARQQIFNNHTPMLLGEEDFFHGWRHQPQLHTAPAFALNVEPVAQEEVHNNWMLQEQGFEVMSDFPAQAAWSDSWQYLPSRDAIPDLLSIPSPPTNTYPNEVVQLKRGPGRPRNYPKNDDNAPKKSGGRPTGSKDSYSRLAKGEKAVMNRKEHKKEVKRRKAQASMKG